MASSSTWIRINDTMPDHPKIEPLSDKAFRLLIESWCWCSRHLTDGYMPVVMWEKRGTKAIRAELERAGLIDFVENHQLSFHDYLDYQRSAGEVQAIRAKNAENGRKGGLAKSKRAASQSLDESVSKSVAPTHTQVSLTSSDNSRVGDVPSSDDEQDHDDDLALRTEQREALKAGIIDLARRWATPVGER
jgi:hypothetical protein